MVGDVHQYPTLYAFLFFRYALAAPQNPPTTPVEYGDFPGFDPGALALLDVYHAGLYDIINCGPRARDVADYLTQVIATAKKARKSAQLGVKSPYGFKALFKTDENKPEVTGFYENVIRGTKYPPWVSTANKVPAFLCINQNDTKIPQAVHDHCSTASELFISTDNPWIVNICESWWIAPEKPDQCPRALSDGSMVPEGDRLAMHKVGAMIHELAHIYAPTGHQLPIIEEAFTLNECLELDEHDSMENAAQYAMFASGKIALVRHHLKIERKLISSNSNSCPISMPRLA